MNEEMNEVEKSEKELLKELLEEQKRSSRRLLINAAAIGVIALIVLIAVGAVAVLSGCIAVLFTKRKWTGPEK